MRLSILPPLRLRLRVLVPLAVVVMPLLPSLLLHHTSLESHHHHFFAAALVAPPFMPSRKVSVVVNVVDTATAHLSLSAPIGGGRLGHRRQLMYQHRFHSSSSSLSRTALAVAKRSSRTKAGGGEGFSNSTATEAPASSSTSSSSSYSSSYPSSSPSSSHSSYDDSFVEEHFQTQPPVELEELRWKLRGGKDEGMATSETESSERKLELLRRKLLERKLSMDGKTSRMKGEGGVGGVLDDGGGDGAASSSSSSSSYTSSSNAAAAATAALPKKGRGWGGGGGAAVKDPPPPPTTLARPSVAATAASVTSDKRRIEALQRRLLERNMKDGQNQKKFKVSAAAVGTKTEADANAEAGEVDVEIEADAQAAREIADATAKALRAMTTAAGAAIAKTSSSLTVDTPTKEAGTMMTAKHKKKAASKDVVVSKGGNGSAVMEGVVGAERALKDALLKKREGEIIAEERRLVIENLKKRYELQIDQLNMKILRLTDQLNRTKNESSRALANERDEMKRTIHKLQTKIASLSDRNAALREEVDNVESRFAGARAGAKALWSTFVQARKDMAMQLDEVRHDSTRELNATKEDLVRLVALEEAMRSELGASAERASEAERMVEELKMKLDEVEKLSAEEKERELEDLEGRIKRQIDERTEELAAKARHFSEKLGTTKAASDRYARIIRSGAAQQIQELEDEILCLRREVEDAKVEINRTRERALADGSSSSSLFSLEVEEGDERDDIANAFPVESTKVEALATNVRRIAEHIHAAKIGSDRKVEMIQVKGDAECEELARTIEALTADLRSAKATVTENAEEAKKIDELKAIIVRATSELRTAREELDRSVMSAREEALEEERILEEELTIARKEMEKAREDLIHATDAARDRRIKAQENNAGDGAGAGAGAEMESVAEQIRNLAEVLRATEIEVRRMLADVHAEARAERKRLKDTISILTAEADGARMDLTREADRSLRLRSDLDLVRSTMTRHLISVRADSGRDLKDLEMSMRSELDRANAARTEERRVHETTVRNLESELAGARAEVEWLRAELDTARRMGGGGADSRNGLANGSVQPIAGSAAGSTAPTIKSEEEKAPEEARMAAERLTEFLTSGKRVAAVVPHNRPAAAVAAAAASAFRYTVQYDNGARDVNVSAKILRPVDPRVTELAVGTQVEVISFHVGGTISPSPSMSDPFGGRGGVGGKGNRRLRGFIVDVKRIEIDGGSSVSVLE